MKFATCLNCMDGRVQLPVMEWIQKNYSIEFVDAITEAGMNGILSDVSKPMESLLLKKIDISLNLHQSELIFIVGHYDCGGNPVDESVHQQQIRDSVQRIIKMQLKDKLSVIGLWVDENWEVHRLDDSPKTT